MNAGKIVDIPAYVPPWIRWLPPSVRIRIERRPNLLKILGNTGWLLADNILRLAAGLVVGVWVARYLGPEQFGLMSYATAFVGMFGVIAGVGLNAIVVRDLVMHPEGACTTMGSAFVLQLLAGLLAYALVLCSIAVVRSADTLTISMVAVLGSAMTFRATDVVKYWFEARVDSKYTVWVENGVFLFCAGLKVVLILSHAPLLAFVWVVLAETVAVAIGFISVYTWRGGVMRSWQIRLSRAKTLLCDSWPLMLSGVAVMVYMRIDQIMLGQMLGDEAVGIYSAAVRISEVWYFVPTAIVASVFPSILEAKKQSEALYLRRLQRLYNSFVLLSLAVAVPATFFSRSVVEFAFGEKYASAGGVLTIHIWAGILVTLNVATGKWFLAEGLQRLIFYRHLTGALANILLNIILIRQYGVAGAAYATLVTYFVVVVLFNAPNRRTRTVLLMEVRAFASILRAGRL